MPTSNSPAELSAAELFALTDGGVGSGVDLLRRRLKFTVRLVWHRRRLLGLQQRLAGHGVGPVLEQDASLLLKGTRPYLWKGLDGAGRFTAQMHHFDWLVQRFSASVVRAFYVRGRRDLLSLQRGSHTVTMHLQPAAGLSREGELELHLCLNDEPVMRAALIVLPASCMAIDGGSQVLCVGSLQGSSGGKDQVHQLTALMERTRPSSLMMQGLQGLAQAWEVSALLGISDQGHVYAGYRGLSKRVGQRYDELWQELGATERCASTHWHLPLQWSPRDESEVPSPKRSQLRRRNALRAQILQACKQSALDL